MSNRKEIEIGETFQDGKKEIICEKAIYLCLTCVYHEKIEKCKTVRCTRFERKDKTDVIYKEVSK